MSTPSCWSALVSCRSTSPPSSLFLPHPSERLASGTESAQMPSLPPDLMMPFSPSPATACGWASTAPSTEKFPRAMLVLEPSPLFPPQPPPQVPPQLPQYLPPLAPPPPPPQPPPQLPPQLPPQPPPQLPAQPPPQPPPQAQHRQDLSLPQPWLWRASGKRSHSCWTSRTATCTATSLQSRRLAAGGTACWATSEIFSPIAATHRHDGRKRIPPEKMRLMYSLYSLI